MICLLIVFHFEFCFLSHKPLAKLLNMKKQNKIALGVSSGVVIGALIGIATGDLGLWISLGLAIGLEWDPIEKKVLILLPI